MERGGFSPIHISDSAQAVLKFNNSPSAAILWLCSAMKAKKKKTCVKMAFII